MPFLREFTAALARPTTRIVLIVACAQFMQNLHGRRRNSERRELMQALMRRRATSHPGRTALAGELIQEVMRDIDLAHAQEPKFDHAIMVPLRIPTPQFGLQVIPVKINC